jgi:hypothetical protein
MEINQPPPDYEQNVQVALDALAEYRTARWAWQDNGHDLSEEPAVLDTADRLANLVPALAGYVRRLSQQPSVTRTPTAQGEPGRSYPPATERHWAPGTWHIHDDYGPHSHEVHRDHRGVTRTD